MEQMVVERRVGREHCCHLIVVRRMDVLINTVARELHLQREGRIRCITSLSRVGANITGLSRVDTPGVPQAHIVPGAGLGPLLTAHALAKCGGENMLQFAGP